MKKSGKPQWIEITRRFVPGSTTIHGSTGSGSYTYATADVEIQECLEKAGLIELRTRTEPVCIYAHKDGNLSLAFAVAVPAVAELEQALKRVFEAARVGKKQVVEAMP